MFDSLRPSEFRIEPSAGDDAAGTPWVLEHRRIAQSNAPVTAPARSGLGRVGLAGAALAALLAHGAAFAALYVATLTEIERLGAGGVEVEAVSVEMIARPDIAPARSGDRNGEVPSSASGAGIPGPKPVTSSLDQYETETAGPSGLPVLAIDAPAPITVDLSLPSDSADVSARDHTPAPQGPLARATVRADDPREARETVTPVANAQSGTGAGGPPQIEGGAPLVTASVSAGASAPAVSPGAVRHYAKAVAEALSRTKPKPGAPGSVRGTVRLAFAVAPDGRLEEVRIVHSSGAPRIDSIAIEAVKAARFPPPPPGMTLAQRSYEIPYVFR